MQYINCLKCPDSFEIHCGEFHYYIPAHYSTIYLSITETWLSSNTKKWWHYFIAYFIQYCSPFMVRIFQIAKAFHLYFLLVGSNIFHQNSSFITCPSFCASHSHKHFSVLSNVKFIRTMELCHHQWKSNFILCHIFVYVIFQRRTAVC